MKLALIGMPGCGKSTIGLMLQQYFALQFIDLDEQIEQQAGMAVREYFAQHGEAKFRQLENQQLYSVCQQDDLLLSTGGGIVLNAMNRRLLQEELLTIYLYCSPEKIYQRLRQDKKRPLLQNVADRKQFLLQMFKIRDPLYRQTAQLVIDTEELDFYAIVDQIKQAITKLT